MKYRIVLDDDTLVEEYQGTLTQATRRAHTLAKGARSTRFRVLDRAGAQVHACRISPDGSSLTVGP